MEQLTKLFKGLSDGNRLKVVGALMVQEELCACQLTEFLNVAGATVSKHMSLLVDAGIVDSRKEGRWVYYRLKRDDKKFRELLNLIQELLVCDGGLKDVQKRLSPIMECEPEALCRKQRGAVCH